MSRFPACPWRLPYGTSVAARLEIGRTLAREAMDSPAVKAFAARVQASCPRCTRVQLAERILADVQNVGWVLDVPGDWMQPVEYTLQHGGDCEDLTNLLMAVCWILGFEATNYWVTREGADWNHITGLIGLPDGDRPTLATAKQGSNGMWWADTTVHDALLGEWVDDALDRRDGIVSPPGYDYRTPEQRAADNATTRELTFVGNVIHVAGETVAAIIASGNRANLNLLHAAATIRLAEVQDLIANAAIGPQLLLLQQQERALEEAKRQSEAALAASAEQTRTYVFAGLAVVAMVAGVYVYTQKAA